MRRHTRPSVLEDLDDQLVRRVAQARNAGNDAATQHLERLDSQWDTERALEANAATLIIAGSAVGLATGRMAMFALPLVVATFLLQHALQGWCPPLTVLRALGLRTRRELDVERFALKASRGDFDGADQLGAERLVRAAAR